VLVPHVIALLGPTCSRIRLFALRKVAEERVGQLTDALVDPATERRDARRLARVFSVCVSQRAADALVLALDDQRFDVRYHVARSLAAIYDRNPRVRIDRDAIISVVLQEISISVPVWESDGCSTGSSASRAWTTWSGSAPSRAWARLHAAVAHPARVSRCRSRFAA
jgi:hypothetical protein